MSSQIDSYLVEKLREILQRLYGYERNKLGGGDEVSQKESPLLRQVEYKRSPSTYPYAPHLGSSFSSKRSSVFGDIDDSEVTSSRDDDKYFDGDSGQNYFVSGVITYNASTTSSVSDTLTYGVEVNVSESSLTDDDNNLTSIVPSTGEDESSALTRNLHEFIHILKMSLKSGSTALSSSHDPKNLFHQHRFHQDIYPSDSYGQEVVDDVKRVPATGSTDPFSGIEAASTTDMEFNLTLDDILDLNNLLQSDDATAGVPVKHLVIIVTYFLIACVSIIGNLLVVQLVIRSRRFHTLTHALLANLAVADLFLATFNIPFSAARVIMTEWPFGSFLCRTVPFVQVTSVYATSFTMAIIAMDRYQVIMNPLGKRLKCSQGIVLVIAIWIVSAILSLPHALNHQVFTVITVRIVKRCQADFGSHRARQLLTVATFLAQYLLPLVFTTVSYISIMKRLWHRSSGLGSATPRQVAAQSRAKRKTIKMLVLTVICFAVSWAPINIYHLLTHFSHIRPNSTAILVCHMMAMSSSMYNPFIFCGLNEHFRREAVKWLHCFRTRRSPLVHPGTEVNGMLTRADQACRRNLSTTVIHTSLSCRRTPPQQVTTISARSGRRNFTASSSLSSRVSTAVQLMPPRNNGSPMERVISPVITTLVPNFDTSRDTRCTSPSRYQPELLFLVKKANSTNEENLSSDDVEPGEEGLNNGDEFLDTLCEDWNLSGSAKGLTVSQSLPDNNEFLSSRESADEDDDEDIGESRHRSGQVETSH